MVKVGLSLLLLTHTGLAFSDRHKATINKFKRGTSPPVKENMDSAKKIISLPLLNPPSLVVSFSLSFSRVTLFAKEAYSFAGVSWLWQDVILQYHYWPRGATGQAAHRRACSLQKDIWQQAPSCGGHPWMEHG